MTEHQNTLDIILKNNASMSPTEVRNILVLYMARGNHIGDMSTKADKLRYLRSYFVNAALDANFLVRGGNEHYKDLLLHNPHLDSVTSVELKDIDFNKYDVVFCASQDETELLKHLQDTYNGSDNHDHFRLAVFSISALLLERMAISQFVFPVCEDLYRRIDFKPGELYVTEEERLWADQWLEQNGMQKHESLYILLDSTSNPIKLIRTRVYFEYLKFLLKREGVKVLIFDEQLLGKEAQYSEWLTEEEMSKMIFCKAQGLRAAMCILASHYTSFLFGPCTGLVHCISSINNRFISVGMPHEEAPIIITYTGVYQQGDSAQNWWGSAPLVNCLLVKERDHGPQVYWLKELPEEERAVEDPLPCSVYTAEMLISRTAALLQAREARRVEA